MQQLGQLGPPWWFCAWFVLLIVLLLHVTVFHHRSDLCGSEFNISHNCNWPVCRRHALQCRIMAKFIQVIDNGGQWIVDKL